MKQLRNPNRASKSRNITIGLLGTSSGVGVTHCGISLANYLATKLGYHTAIVEWNNHNHFVSLREAINADSRSTMFTLHQVDYYMEATELDMVTIYNKEYDFIILDCGEYRDRFTKEFLVSDVKLVIGSLCEWKRHDVVKVLSNGREQIGSNQWRYFASLGQGYDIKLFHQEYGFKLKAIPYIPDPYVLTKPAMEAWKNIVHY